MRIARLKSLETHFRFGENWKEFSEGVNQTTIDQAVTNLKRLLGRERLDGLSFADIGCGSGVHSVAAALLGASVSAFDLDPISVETTQAVCRKFKVDSMVTVREQSVFDLPEEPYDIVYSWGVLHHTGDMWTAIDKASKLARKPGGELALALYRKTGFCRFWKFEKRLYAKSPRPVQFPLRVLFTAISDVRRVMSRQSPREYRRAYVSQRGMSLKHDVHDWLGGYPYESVAPWELRAFLSKRGFSEKRSFVLSDTKIPLQPLGSGCDEYLFERL